MNTRPIKVVGTFQGYWTQELGQELAQGEISGLPPIPSTGGDLDILLKQSVDSNVMILVEHPAIGLAHRLDSGDDLDPEAWLDDWMERARALLGHAQQHPATTLVVNADDGRRRPQRLAQLLRSRWELALSVPSRLEQKHRPDVLAQALAWSFIERDIALEDLAAELLASCVVLPGLRPAHSRLVPDDFSDGIEAARRLSALLRSEQRLIETEMERDVERGVFRSELKALADHCERTELARQGVESDLSRAQAALAETERQRSGLASELVEARRTAQTAVEENDLLVRQLHRVQEGLEQNLLDKRAAEKAAPAVKPGSDGHPFEKELRASLEECELLTLQTHQIQQELERLHTQNRQLAHDAKSRVALPGLADVAIGEARVIGERTTPPHRELSFVVRDVKAGERMITEASVRLVEHWGRPGLVVFSDEDQPALLEAWRESGREGERPYMLLVHGEETARRVYDAMGTLDWQLIQALIIRLGQSVQDSADELSPGWQALAQRLLTSVQELPPRLRYGSIVVAPLMLEPSRPVRFGLTLEQASYHGRSWERLLIEWEPLGPTPSFALGSDVTSGPPLLAWPADEEGIPARMLRLPLGEDPNAADVRAVWDSLSGSDRSFVSELLNLMPIFAVHLQAALPRDRDTAEQADLQAAAAGNMVFGRVALQPLPTGPQVERRRPLLLRMIRRLGGSPSARAMSPAATSRVLER